MLTDIEIAQSVKLRHISEIAQKAGIPEEYLELYGRNKAKIDLSLLKNSSRENGKLILVMQIFPLHNNNTMLLVLNKKSFPYLILIKPFNTCPKHCKIIFHGIGIIKFF